MNRIITRGFGPSQKIVPRGYGGEYIPPGTGAAGSVLVDTVSGLIFVEATHGDISGPTTAGQASASSVWGNMASFESVGGRVEASSVRAAIEAAEASGEVVSILDYFGDVLGVALPDGVVVLLENPSGKVEADE